MCERKWGRCSLHHHIEITEENSQHVHKPATSPSSLHLYPDCSSSHDNIMASTATVSTLGFVPPPPPPPPPQPLSRSLSRMRHSRLEQPRATSGGRESEREGGNQGGREANVRAAPASPSANDVRKKRATLRQAAQLVRRSGRGCARSPASNVCQCVSVPLG